MPPNLKFLSPIKKSLTSPSLSRIRFGNDFYILLYWNSKYLFKFIFSDFLKIGLIILFLLLENYFTCSSEYINNYSYSKMLSNYKNLFIVIGIFTPSFIRRPSVLKT